MLISNLIIIDVDSDVSEYQAVFMMLHT